VFTNTLVFQDSDAVSVTNTWTYSYPFLPAANGLALGSFSTRGWDIRIVQTNGPTLGNDLSRAEQQLVIPPLIPSEVSTQTVVQVLNFNDAGDGSTATDFGYFPNASPVLGLPPDSSHENIAGEFLAYLELPAGAHRFGVVSDDGFQLRSGASVEDPAAVTLGIRDGGTFNNTFDFVVEATGLYPARCVWYENGGGAYFQLFSVNPNDPNARILLNDPANPSGVIKAYLPFRVASAADITGPYTTPAGAVLDPVNKTVTIPLSGSIQFFQMQTLTQVRLTSIRVVGANVIITYN
jgi:hypothetical protein